MMQFHSVKELTGKLIGDIYVLSEPPPVENAENIKT